MAATALPAELQNALEAEADRLRPFASRIVYFREIGSTSDVAGMLASEGAAEGTLVIADEQTAGRGRSGRTWFSPPGAGLYVSVVLRPHVADASQPWPRLITLAAGVGVAEGIRAASGLPVELKWPNDVVIADRHGAMAHERRWRKLAGILAEASAVGRELHHVVLGFGINVHQSPMPVDIAASASSLEQESGRAIDRGRVLVEALAGLRTWHAALDSGREGAVVARWLELSPSARGARVSVEQGRQQYDGTTAGIDSEGALRVRSGREVMFVQSGEVSWL